MIDKIHQSTGGWIDKQDIEYYIEQTDLPLSNRFVNLIIQNYNMTKNMQSAITLSAGIIKQDLVEKDYLQEAMSIAAPYYLQVEIESSYNKYIDEGFSEERSAAMALYDWDL